MRSLRHYQYIRVLILCVASTFSNSTTDRNRRKSYTYTNVVWCVCNRNSLSLEHIIYTKHTKRTSSIDETQPNTATSQRLVCDVSEHHHHIQNKIRLNNGRPSARSMCAYYLKKTRLPRGCCQTHAEGICVVATKNSPINSHTMIPYNGAHNIQI